MFKEKHSTLRTIVGAMEDNGLFIGTMKLAGAGGRSLAEIFWGIEKSSISLLSTIPVLGDKSCAPKYEFTVLVIDMAFRWASIMLKWLVPWSLIRLHLGKNNLGPLAHWCERKLLQFMHDDNCYTNYWNETFKMFP